MLSMLLRMCALLAVGAVQSLPAALRHILSAKRRTTVLVSTSFQYPCPHVSFPSRPASHPCCSPTPRHGSCCPSGTSAPSPSSSPPFHAVMPPPQPMPAPSLPRRHGSCCPRGTSAPSPPCLVASTALSFPLTPPSSNPPPTAGRWRPRATATATAPPRPPHPPRPSMPTRCTTRSYCPPAPS